MEAGQESLPPSEGAAKRGALAIIADLAKALTNGTLTGRDDPLIEELIALSTDVSRLPRWIEDLASGDEIEAARVKHAHGSDNEIEIDSDARVSRGDVGVWVQGWLWLPHKDDEDEEEV